MQVGVLVVLLGVVACSNAQTEDGDAIAKDVDVEEFATLIEGGEGVLLDVRTPEEYAEGHIEDALNIDFWGDDFEAQIQELDKATPVYVYCKSGGRSGQAMDLMAELGFSEVYNLDGGYKAWSK